MSVVIVIDPVPPGGSAVFHPYPLESVTIADEPFKFKYASEYVPGPVTIPRPNVMPRPLESTPKMLRN